MMLLHHNPSDGWITARLQEGLKKAEAEEKGKGTKEQHKPTRRRSTATCRFRADHAATYATREANSRHRRGVLIDRTASALRFHIFTTFCPTRAGAPWRGKRDGQGKG